eukprot:11203930-Lingulodinium_polyedra.AAC.1
MRRRQLRKARALAYNCALVNARRQRPVLLRRQCLNEVGEHSLRRKRRPPMHAPSRSPRAEHG